MEDMLVKVLQRVESTNSGVKKMKGDLSNMSQIVDSHSTFIKQLEHQMGKLSTTLDKRKNGTLPSDTIKNLRKDGHCMVVTTRRSKILPEPVLISIDQEKEVESKSKNGAENEVDEEVLNDSKEPKSVEVTTEEVEGSKSTDGPKIEVLQPLTPVHIPPTPFSQRLKKKSEDGKFLKFISMLKKLSIIFRR